MIKKIYFTSLLIFLSGMFKGYSPYGSSTDQQFRKAFLIHCGKLLHREDLTKAIDLSYSIFDDRESLDVNDENIKSNLDRMKIKKNSRKWIDLFTEAQNIFILSHILFKAMCIFASDEAEEFFTYNKFEETPVNINNQFFTTHQEEKNTKYKLFFYEYEKNIQLFYELITPKDYQFLLTLGLEYVKFTHNSHEPKAVASIFIPNNIPFPENQEFIQNNIEKVMNFITGYRGIGGVYLKKYSFYDCAKTLIRIICYGPYVDPVFLLLKKNINTKEELIDRTMKEIGKNHISIELKNKIFNNAIFAPTATDFTFIDFIDKLHKKFVNYVSFFTEEEEKYWHNLDYKQIIYEEHIHILENKKKITMRKLSFHIFSD